jgi:hypothetical protein
LWGETLKITDLNDMIFSYSDDWAYNYASPDEKVGFEQLHMMTQVPDVHWANHRFQNGHEPTRTSIPGFNMLVLDVDGGVSSNWFTAPERDQVHDLHHEAAHGRAEPLSAHHADQLRCWTSTRTSTRSSCNEVIAWLPFQS